MNRRALQVRSVVAAQRACEHVLDAGECHTRDEYYALRRVYRAASRYSGGYHYQQALRALEVLPKQGPGAKAFYLAVTYPAFLRRYQRQVRLHGIPGGGSPND